MSVEWETWIFKKNWKIKAPQMVLAFSWKVLKNRIPTKINLNRRRALGNSRNLSCAFFNGEDEIVEHLFITCRSVYKVWMNVFDWLGLEVALPSGITELYLQYWAFLERNK